jgi:catechol 2,3-dioxygenase-like lactoylglutathione lyase family enzyme
MAESKGLPGLRGTDHIGITAPDFDQAVDFFTDVLGLEPFYEMGPFGSSDDNFMQDMLNVNPRAVIQRVKQFRCGSNTNIELFEYESPDQRKKMPKNSDWGGHHIALYVDDIDAAMDHLKNHGECRWNSLAIQMARGIPAKPIVDYGTRGVNFRRTRTASSIRGMNRLQKLSAPRIKPLFGLFHRFQNANCGTGYY